MWPKSQAYTKIIRGPILNYSGGATNEQVV